MEKGLRAPSRTTAWILIDYFGLLGTDLGYRLAAEAVAGAGRDRHV
jgi:hypothetical protein